MLGKWTVTGCLFLGSIGLALPARAIVGALSPHLVDTECVGQVSGNCLLKSQHRSIELAVDTDQKLVAQFSSEVVAESVPVETDLAARVESGELTAEQSAEIARELTRLEGMAYRLPSIDALKQDLGFPKDSSLEAGDLADLVRAHLQVVFGMSALSAAYLADRLGIKTIEDSALR